MQLTSAFYIMYSVHCETASCLLWATLHLYLSFSLFAVHQIPILAFWLHSFASVDSRWKSLFSAQGEEDFHLRTLAVMTVRTLQSREKCFCTPRARVILGQLVGKCWTEASWNFLESLLFVLSNSTCPCECVVWLPFKKNDSFLVSQKQWFGHIVSLLMARCVA